MQKSIMSMHQLQRDFAQNKSWDAQYRLLIQLGKKLPCMDESDKNLRNEVQGCASAAWLKVHIEGDRYQITMHSDTRIVRGLMMILLVIYQDKNAEQILAVHINDIFTELGLLNHLSPSRANGLFAIVKRITQLGIDGNDE